MNKRGQFYLIAAVIISSVIISIVSVRNYAVVEKEPKNFFDISSQIKDEAARVIDYGAIGNEDKMRDFARNVSESLRKTDPSVEVIMVFGNSSGVTVINFGNKTAEVGNIYIPGALEDVENNIILNVSDTEFKKQGNAPTKLFVDTWETPVPVSGKKEVTVRINEQDYYFKLYEYQQFFMIIKKGEKGEEYVEVK